MTFQRLAHRIVLMVLAALSFSQPLLQAQVLIDVDLNGYDSIDGLSNENTQTGAAILGSSDDNWNGFALSATQTSGSYPGLINSAGTATSVSFSYQTAGDGGSWDNENGTAMDSGTSSLMEDYINSPGGTTTATFGSLSGYSGDRFEVVVYGAGDTSGQGDSLTLSGSVSGGNTGSTLLTSGASRQLSSGEGVAYQIYNGIITGDSFTIIANALNGDHSVFNGFQLYISPPLGFDISTLYAPLITPLDWKNIYAAGYSFVIVGTWGGSSNGGYNIPTFDNNNNINGFVPLGQSLLQNAQIAGLQTGAFCLLSWTTNYSGTYQIQQAIARAGTQASQLSFMAVDVEYNNTTTPLGSTTPSQRIARIADAIQAVRNAGLVPIIYSSPDGWSQVTGGTTEISNIQLWDKQENIPANPNLGTPPVNYGVFTSRFIKQYDLDVNLPNPYGTQDDFALQSGGALSVDLDSCSASAFSTLSVSSAFRPAVVSKASQGSEGTGVTFIASQLSGGTTITLGGGVTNSSSVYDAVATRIIGAMLVVPGQVTGTYSTLTTISSLPIILNTIPASGSVQVTSPLTFTPPMSYHGPATLKISFTYGGASTDSEGSGQTLTQRIIIP